MRRNPVKHRVFATPKPFPLDSMKSLSNRVLIITLAVCALAVLASSHLAEMHGQEKVTLPAGVAEELPGRRAAGGNAAEPPILYGNQTPFGQITESGSSEPVTNVEVNSTQSQTVKRESFDLLSADPQSDGVLPDRSSDSGALQFAPAPIGSVLGPAVNSSTPSPLALPLASSPATSLPSPSILNNTVPVTQLNVAPATGCTVCGSKTCTICCQPKCITRSLSLIHI